MNRYGAHVRRLAYAVKRTFLVQFALIQSIDNVRNQNINKNFFCSQTLEDMVIDR